MFDYKKFAMVLGIMILLPLFLGLFMDAVYPEPKYEDFCKDSMYSYPVPAAKPGIPPAQNCTTNIYGTAEAINCTNWKGQPRIKYDENGCELFDRCDFCSLHYNDVKAVYNRNLFFILAPIGLIVIIIGIYFSLDYMGAGLMLGGLITLFYGTIRYFSDMSKLLRALVILVELLIILWIGYKKIGSEKPSSGNLNDLKATNSTPLRRKRKKV